MTWFLIGVAALHVVWIPSDAGHQAMANAIDLSLSGVKGGKLTCEP